MGKPWENGKFIGKPSEKRLPKEPYDTSNMQQGLGGFLSRKPPSGQRLNGTSWNPGTSKNDDLRYSHCKKTCMKNNAEAIHVITCHNK